MVRHLISIVALPLLAYFGVLLPGVWRGENAGANHMWEEGSWLQRAMARSLVFDWLFLVLLSLHGVVTWFTENVATDVVGVTALASLFVGTWLAAFGRPTLLVPPSFRA